MDSYEKTTRIITVFNYIAGLRNFIDPRKNLLKFVCSWIWNMSLIFIIAIVEFYFHLHVLRIAMPYNIERIIYVIQYSTHAFGYTSTMIIGLYQSKNVLVLIKQIDKVDENLRNLGIKIDYHNLFHHVIIVGSFWILNATIIYGIFLQWIIQQNPDLNVIVATICYTYATNAQSVILYEYNAAIFWLGSRFKMINQLLKTLLPKNDERNAKESSEEIICKPSSNFRNQLEIDCSVSARPSEISQTSSMNDTSNFKKGSPTDEKLRLFQQIRFLHLQMCNVSKMVNQIFNVQILIYTFSQLLYSSIIIYYIYMEIRRKSNLKLVLTIIYLLDSIIGVLKIVLMSIDCEYAMKQADKIISLIHACPLYRESAELKNETLQFLWQISYTQLEDTKSVHYVLNYSFVRNCFYFALTYLVIMVQLSQNLTVTDQTTVTYKTSSFQTVLQKNASIIA